MTADSRACREHFPFRHLSLAEIAEFDGLMNSTTHGRGSNRLYELWARRVNPQSVPKPKESV